MAWARLLSSGGVAAGVGDGWGGGVCLALGMWGGMKGLGFLCVITIAHSIACLAYAWQGYRQGYITAIY